MKICHVITRMIVGGAQENTLLTCNGLRERGYDVTLLTGPDAGPEGSLLEDAREAGIDTRIIVSMHRRVDPLSDLRAKRELTAAFRTVMPDVVHTHSSKAGILGRVAARDAGAPVIVHTLHGMSINRTQPWWLQALYRRLERYCGPFTHRFISVADAMTDQAVSAGIAPRERFVTIHSGMRTDWYDPARHDRSAIRREWGMTDDDAVVGTIARLFRNKGYEQLIPAMAKAAREQPNLRFVWIGDGRQRAAYERRLTQLGLRNRVHLTGLVRPARVAALLAGIDLLVHPSQWEGLPRAVVQALLMAKPAVSFDIDGAPEIVRPGRTGILVPLNDIDGLAAAMVELARNRELRDAYGKAGRRLCLEKFNQQLMVDAIESVYKELAEQRV